MFPKVERVSIERFGSIVRHPSCIIYSNILTDYTPSIATLIRSNVLEIEIIYRLTKMCYDRESRRRVLQRPTLKLENSSIECSMSEVNGVRGKFDHRFWTFHEIPLTDSFHRPLERSGSLSRLTISDE